MKFLKKYHLNQFIYLLVFLLFSTFIYSQNALGTGVLKGSKLLGVSIGGFSYNQYKQRSTSSDSPEEYKSNSNYFGISIYPNAAWFIADRFAIGTSVSLSYSGGTTKNPDNPEYKNSYDQAYFYLGPMARYYFGSSSKGMPFGQVNIEYGFYTGKSKNIQENKVNTTKNRPRPQAEFGALGGYELFINEHIGFYVTAGVYYVYSKSEYEYIPATGEGYISKSSTNSWLFPVNVGLQLHLPSKTSGR